MTLKEFENSPKVPATEIGHVILERHEYTLEEWIDDEAIINIKSEYIQENHDPDRETFFIKKYDPIVYWDSNICPKILKSVYAVKIEDIDENNLNFY